MAKVRQLINNNGNPAANQFIILDGSKVYFQSYNSVVAEYDKVRNTVRVTPLWDYSATTRKHFYIFLHEYYKNLSRKEILNEIENGTIVVVKDGDLDF